MPQGFSLLGEHYSLLFRRGGLEGFTTEHFVDVEILTVLQNYCVRQECVYHILWQAGWNVERFVDAQMAVGLRGEELEQQIVKFHRIGPDVHPHRGVHAHDL